MATSSDPSLTPSRATIAISVSGIAVPTAARMLPTAPTPTSSRWPIHSTALVKISAPVRTIAKLTSRRRNSIRAGYLPRPAARSGEIKGQAEDEVDREKLHTLEPGRLAVGGDVVADEDRQQDRAELEAVEDERQRIGADEEGGEDEDRGDEEGDLGAGADRDVDGEVHLVLHRDQHRDPVLSRVADDRDDDHADEELGEADRLRGLGDRPD